MSESYDFKYSRTIDNGFERCVRCGIVFGAECRTDDIRGEEHPPGIGGGVNQTYGPVCDPSGTSYESVCESEPGTYLMHVDCYVDWVMEIESDETKSFDDYKLDSGNAPKRRESK